MSEANKHPARRSGVTLKQFADEVGVSAATVSRVRNFYRSLSVGEGTRHAIIETAESLKYEPPRKRRQSQLYGKQNKIALLHCLSPEQELANPYYVSLRLGIDSRCATLRLEMTKLYQTDRFPKAAVFKNLAGLILIGHHSDEEIQWISAHNSNVVFADYKPDGDTVDAIESDVVVAKEKLLDSLQALNFWKARSFGVRAPDVIKTTTQPRGSKVY